MLGGPSPATLVATTLNVIRGSFIRPGTVQVVPEVVQDAPTGAAVAVYFVIIEPPLSAGDHETLASWFAGNRGRLNRRRTVNGVTGAEAAVGAVARHYAP